MKAKHIAVLVAFVLLFGLVSAAFPDVNSLEDMNSLSVDGNHYYPKVTTTISFTVNDPDGPADVNILLGYRLTSTATLTSITSGAAGDANSNNFCSLPITTADQVCTYTWTLPTGLDGYYVIDVNVYDITNADDANASGVAYIDSNACDTARSISSDTITLTTVCTGYGTDANAGTETTLWNKNRQGGCADRFSTYEVPFKLALGEITVCYYSTDGLGNTEAEQSFVHEASASALSLIILTELALVAVLLFAILATFLVFHKDLSAETMVPLVAVAVLMVISIVIFAAII